MSNPTAGRRNVDLIDLLMFIEVVDCGNYTEVARRRDVARSSICRRIKSLEAKLGVRLVWRNTRTVAITELGMQIYALAVGLKQISQAVMDHVAIARDGVPRRHMLNTPIDESTLPATSRQIRQILQEMLHGSNGYQLESREALL